MQKNRRSLLNPFVLATVSSAAMALLPSCGKTVTIPGFGFAGSSQVVQSEQELQITTDVRSPKLNSLKLEGAQVKDGYLDFALNERERRVLVVPANQTVTYKCLERGRPEVAVAWADMDPTGFELSMDEVKAGSQLRTLPGHRYRLRVNFKNTRGCTKIFIALMILTQEAVEADQDGPEPNPRRMPTPSPSPSPHSRGNHSH